MPLLVWGGIMRDMAHWPWGWPRDRFGEWSGGAPAHPRRTGVWVVGVVSFVVLAWAGWRGVPATGSLADPRAGSVTDGLVSGVFVAGAVFAAFVSWRRHARPWTGWTVAAGALVAGQSLLVTLPAMASPPPRSTLALAAMLAVCIAGSICVLSAVAGLHLARHVLDDSFGIGLGMGFMAAGHLLLQVPLDTPRTLPVQVLIGLLAGTHLLATALVLRQRVLPGPMARLLVVTVLLVVGGLAVLGANLETTFWTPMLSVALAAVGAAWLGNTWAFLQRSAGRSADVPQEEVDYVLLATTRDQRERMHELRSTVAGLVQGSAMMDSSEITEEVRQHLWESVRRELERMQRLLAGDSGTTTDLDLDEALRVILDLQRLKGRHVELHTSGYAVQARYDSLAEVVNILMDNAVTHGGSDNSVVEVARRDDETVDITVTDFGRGIPHEQREHIFEWGERRVGSPGEGIGLHVAQRLMTEDGGSLRLAEAQGAGSSFVISLPAVRRSTENHPVGEDSHADWRRSS